jgi:hypothetical protein
MTLKEMLLRILFLTVLVVGGIVLIGIYSHWLVAIGVFALIYSSKFRLVDEK